MKKTKFMTKVMAVVFALAILFAMSVPAFAADTTNNTNDASGSLSSPTPNLAIKTVDPTSHTITLNKSLIVFNQESISVYEPNINYTYTVGPYTLVDETQARVKDKDDNIVYVNDGVPGGLTVTTTPTFSDANPVNASATGTVVEKPLVLTVHDSVFTKAGIFRYVLEDTTNVSTALNTVGITRPSGYSTNRYIDLYVTNNGGSLVVNNAVIFVATSTLDPATGMIDTSTIKTTGFNEEDDGDSDYTDDKAADHYYTYNLKVTKTTTGQLADKQHPFPFAIQISSIKAAKITKTTDGSSYTVETVTSNTVGGTNLATPQASLKNGDYIEYCGIPYGASATVSEYNNTYDTYKATGSTRNASTQITLSETELTSSPTYSGTTVVATMQNILIDAGTAHDETDNKQRVTGTTEANFTNQIKDISPTGLVFRVAPYVLMLAAGVSLIVLFAKRRREITDMI